MAHVPGTSGPRGQLASVGGGFHGGSPQGCGWGFQEGKGQQDTFLLHPGTLGLCSQLSLRTGLGPGVGWGGRLGMIECSLLGVLLKSARRGAEGDRVPHVGPASTGGALTPGTGRPPLAPKEAECCSLPLVPVAGKHLPSTQRAASMCPGGWGGTRRGRTRRGGAVTGGGSWWKVSGRGH